MAEERNFASFTDRVDEPVRSPNSAPFHPLGDGLGWLTWEVVTFHGSTTDDLVAYDGTTGLELWRWSWSTYLVFAAPGDFVGGGFFGRIYNIGTDVVLAARFTVSLAGGAPHPVTFSSGLGSFTFTYGATIVVRLDVTGALVSVWWEDGSITGPCLAADHWAVNDSGRAVLTGGLDVGGSGGSSAYDERRIVTIPATGISTATVASFTGSTKFGSAFAEFAYVVPGIAGDGTHAALWDDGTSGLPTLAVAASGGFAYGSPITFSPPSGIGLSGNHRNLPLCQQSTIGDVEGITGNAFLVTIPWSADPFQVVPCPWFYLVASPYTAATVAADTGTLFGDVLLIDATGSDGRDRLNFPAGWVYSKRVTDSLFLVAFITLKRHPLGGGWETKHNPYGWTQSPGVRNPAGMVAVLFDLPTFTVTVEPSVAYVDYMGNNGSGTSSLAQWGAADFGAGPILQLGYYTNRSSFSLTRVRYNAVATWTAPASPLLYSGTLFHAGTSPPAPGGWSVGTLRIRSS